MSAEVQGQGHKTQTWTRCHRQTEIPGETHRRPRSGRAEQGCSGGKEGHGRGGGRAAAACLDPGVHSEGLERLPGGAQGPGGSLAPYNSARVRKRGPQSSSGSVGPGAPPASLPEPRELSEPQEEPRPS